MNTKAKGNRNERKGRDLLYKWGAHAVVKAGASLGVFDLLALLDGEVVAVQVKTNRNPSKAEMQALRDFPRLSYLKKMLFVYKDRQREPDITTID